MFASVRTLGSMALTARQRNALPDRAFLDQRARRYPAPTPAEAKRAGISEAQRRRIIRSGLQRTMVRTNAAGTKRVKGVPGYQKYATFAKRRGAGKGIATLTGPHGTTVRPGLKSRASARHRGRARGRHGGTRRHSGGRPHWLRAEAVQVLRRPPGRPRRPC